MLKRDEAFLLLVDIQGKLATIVDGHEAVAANACRMVRGAQIFGMPVIACEQNKLGETIAPLAELLSGTLLHVKSTFSAWGDAGIRAAIKALAGRKQAIIVGIEAHICVYQTARDLRREGFEVFVVADAVSSRQRADKEIALARLGRDGVALVSVEMALFELLVTAEDTAARQIFALVK